MNVNIVGLRRSITWLLIWSFLLELVCPAFAIPWSENGRRHRVITKSDHKATQVTIGWKAANPKTTKDGFQLFLKKLGYNTVVDSAGGVAKVMIRRKL